MSKDKPEIRFAGYTDAWEERKLKELFQPSKNKNNNGLYNQKDILAASLGTELIPKRTFFGLKSTKESVKNYRIVKTGDLIYTKSPIKGFPNGIIRSNKGNVGIVPPLYCVYTLQKDINSSIIQLYFEDKNRLDFYLFPLVNVGARNNVNITDLEFLEGKVTIPKSYEEQSKIVHFMEQLNTTIALHQRKLDLLKEQKKGYLQKMFPKNGAKVPELRFAGFADDWEKRKLIEIAYYRNGKAHEKNILENGKYIVVNSKFVSTNGHVKKYTNSLIEPLKKGEIAFVLSDVPNGKAIAKTFLIDSNNKYSLNQRVAGITPKQEIDDYFLNIIMNRNSYFLKFDNGVGQTNLSKSEVENFFDSYPNYSEQQKIGGFFRQLDNLITVNQRRVDLLKQEKKALLQKMFV